MLLQTEKKPSGGEWQVLGPCSTAHVGVRVEGVKGRAPTASFTRGEQDRHGPRSCEAQGPARKTRVLALYKASSTKPFSLVRLLFSVAKFLNLRDSKNVLAM